MDTTIQTGANASQANQGVPPPPPGFVPDQSVSKPAGNATVSNVPPPPPGFVPDQSAGASAPSQTPMATMSAIPEPSGVLDAGAQYMQSLANDIRHGTSTTKLGALLKRMGAQGTDMGNAPDVGEFMASLPLGILTAVKGAAELPQAGKRFQGAKDALGGVLQAATIPASFMAPEEAELGSAGINKAGEAAKDAATATVEGAGKALKGAKNLFSLKNVQNTLANTTDAIRADLGSELSGIRDDWHQAVRDTLDQVSREAGVKPNPAQSLNDVAANLSAAIKAKASGLYKQLDQAIGGTRFQTFDEQLSNVKKALRNSAGIDPDADGRLVERINALEDAKAKALEQAEASGVNPNLIHEANATHRQAMALADLDRHIKMSIEGLRSDVGTAATKAAPETLSTTKLAPRLNRMYGTGRLQQALGDSRADDILEAVESAKQRAKDAAETAVRKTEAAQADAARSASNVKLRRTILESTLGGGLGFELLKHFVE